MVAFGAAVVVWFMGFDPLWAVATVLAVGLVGVALANLGLEEDAVWDTPGREARRGIRLTIPVIEAALAACDRLARPTSLRRVRAVIIAERDDRLARSALVRRMRALLVAELRARGINPANRFDDDAVVALLGPDAITILQPDDGTPVTTAAIARCLDRIERLGTDTKTRIKGAP